MTDPGRQDPIFLRGSADSPGAVRIAIVLFTSIALYNACELAVLIPLSFRRYRSLYFWALLTSTVLGVIPATVGQSLQFFNRAPLWLNLVVSNVGFVAMVPNQSVVLYSRLHLVSQNAFVLTSVRWMTIFGFIGVAVPIVVLDFGATDMPQSAGWARAFDVTERLQVTWFMVQECLISTAYIWEAVRLIKLSSGEDRRRHKIMYELLAINVAAIAMDLSLVSLQYVGLYFTQVLLKTTVYSIKLKMEFAVLGMLVSIARSHTSEPSFWRAE